MLKNTHIECSTSLVLIFIFLSYTTISYFWYWVFPIYTFLLLPILAVLPDSDHPESYLNVKFPFLKWLSRVWSHRTWSHDIWTVTVVSIILYMLFWKLFWYYDYTINTEATWFDKILEYIYFFIKSPNFLWIFIAMFWHIFWDFLTKWTIKFFYWSELLTNTILRIKLLRYTIWLPFFLLYKFQYLVNKIKWNLFPTTWSIFEKNIYATIFNLLNYVLIWIMLFVIWINTNISNSLTLITWEWEKLPIWKLILFLIFFWISMWYFFELSKDKLSKYYKTWKWILKFLISEITLFFVLYFLYTTIDIFNQYWIALLIIMIACSVFLYRKFIKLEYDYLNVILNECILLIIYIFLTIFVVKATIIPQKFIESDKPLIEIESLTENVINWSKEKLNDLNNLKEKAIETVTETKNNNTKVNNNESNKATIKDTKKAPVRDTTKTKKRADSIFDESEFN